MFSDSSRNYIRNKVRKFKNPFFDISFNLIYNIYMSLVQVTPDVTLSNVTLPITCYWINILKIQPLNYMFYMFLTCMPIFISIECYLPFDL